MCFEFSSCFGGGRKDDYGGERSNHGGCGGRRRGRRGDRGNRNGYNAADDDHKQATAYYDHQPAVDEEGRKAHHDGARKPDRAAVVAGAGGHGYYAAYAPDKFHGTPKLLAWQNKVVDDAGYADHREHAAMDYHHYPSTTTTLVRY